MEYSNWQLILPLMPAVFLLLGANAGAFGQKEPAPGAAQLEQALVGTWVLDAEATADSMARGQFGTQRTVTVSKTGGQPMTVRTNLMNKPFDQKEYEKQKRILLEALGTNDRQIRMTFSPSGTGAESGLNESGVRLSEPFHWKLQGRVLTVRYEKKRPGEDFQTELVRTNELRRPMDFLRAYMVFKPETPGPAAGTNAPGRGPVRR